MENQLTIVSYKGIEIAFDFLNDDVMVNATEMGKVFNKKPIMFLRLEETKNFLNALRESDRFKEKIDSKGAFDAPLESENEEDFVDNVLVKTIPGRHHSGTWMHRLVSLKFASWLDARFEVWIYETIDSLLKGFAEEREETLKRKAHIQIRIENLEKKLSQNEDFLELRMLESQSRQASYGLGKINSSQLSLFRNRFKPNK